MASTHFFWTGVQVHGFDAFLFPTAASTHFFVQTPPVFDAFLHLKQVFDTFLLPKQVFDAFLLLKQVFDAILLDGKSG